MASINFFYQKQATQLMSLNITDSEMYALIPSENDDKLYRVDMNEEKMQATKCECLGFRRWNKCKHATVVNAAFDGYKAPVEEKITEVEKGEWYIINKNTQVWMNDGQWIAVGPTENAIEIVKSHLEKQSAVAEAEKIVATPVERATRHDKDLCCKVYADNGEIVDVAAHAAKMKLQREAYEAEITVKRKPRKYATEYLENQQHYANIKSQMAEIRERRKAEEGNLYKAYALMR